MHLESLDFFVVSTEVSRRCLGARTMNQPSTSSRPVVGPSRAPQPEENDLSRAGPSFPPVRLSENMPQQQEPHRPPSNPFDDVTPDDIRFLESCVTKRIRNYTLSGSLSFLCITNSAFKATDIADVVDPNSGPFALSSDKACNSAFLEQEAWLLSTYRELATIHLGVLHSIDEKVSQLSALLRQEWARMEIHKECEWIRQVKTRTACGYTGAPLVDTGQSS